MDDDIKSPDFILPRQGNDRGVCLVTPGEALHMFLQYIP